jgi:hypothetical protein
MKLTISAIAVLAAVTGVVAPPPENIPAPPPPELPPKEPVPAPVQPHIPELNSPYKSKNPKPVYSREAFKATNPILALALEDPNHLVEGDAFDKAYKLPKGTMMSCLDAVFHADKRGQLDVGDGYAVVKDAPVKCTTIVREVSSRSEYKGLKDDEKVAHLVGDNSIRINGLSKRETDYIAKSDMFEVRIL